MARSDWPSTDIVAFLLTTLAAAEFKLCFEAMFDVLCESHVQTTGIAKISYWPIYFAL